MNNHGIICKNNNMIIFLIFLIIIILILINKKVKISIDFSVIGFEYNFCISVNYFFDIVTLYKEDILKYKDKLKRNNKSKKSNKNIKKYKWILEYIQFDRINLETRIGLIDIFVTSMAIPIFSTLLALILQKYFRKSTKRFLVKPVYNELFFSLKGVTDISIKLKDLLIILIKVLKEKGKISE